MSRGIHTEGTNELHVDGSRVVLVNSDFGVSTLYYRNGEVLFTSVPAAKGMEGGVITTSVMMDSNRIIAGYNCGKIAIHLVPDSVRFDEETNLLGLVGENGYNPELCFTVTEIVAEIIVVSGGRCCITSVTHCRDSRNIVYYTTDDPKNQIGCIIPMDGGDRDGGFIELDSTYRGNWFCD